VASLLADSPIANTRANVQKIQGLNELTEIFCQWGNRYVAFSEINKTNIYQGLLLDIK